MRLSKKSYGVWQSKPSDRVQKQYVFTFFKSFLMLIVMTSHSPSGHAELLSFDPRSHSMGGIGVTSSDYLTAPFHNPALTAKFDDVDDVGILFPAVGYRIHDKGQILDGADKVVDRILDFRSELSLDNANNVVVALRELQGDTAFVQAGIGFAVAMPGDTLSVNLFSKYYADVFALSDLAEGDFSAQNIIDNNGRLESRLNMIGITILDVGVALAKPIYTELGTLMIGASPKLQKVGTVNYIVNIDNFSFSRWREDVYGNEYSRFNLDVGFAFDFANGLIVGVSGRNVVHQTYDLKPVLGVGGQYEVNPVFTSSVSYNGDWLTVGVDLDLNDNERFGQLSGTLNPVVNELDNTRMLGVGLELNVWDWIKLRGGGQTDLNNNLKNQITFGAAFTPFDVFHFDIAGSYGGEDQYGWVTKVAFLF